MTTLLDGRFIDFGAGILTNPNVELTFVNSTQIKLIGVKNLGYVTIYKNAKWQIVELPSGGVTLANTGLVQANLYYIYLYDNLGTLALEASLTAHETNATSGIEIKTGNPTRTLVGMVYTGTGTPGIFVDSSTQRFTRSWYNKKIIGGSNFFTSNKTLSATVPTVIDSASNIEILLWAGERYEAHFTGACYKGINEHEAGCVGFDGAAVGGFTNAPSQQTGYPMPISAFAGDEITVTGYHYFSMMGYGNTGATATFHGNANPPARCTLTVSIFE